MTIEYKIDQNDYLTHQLFIASKSELIRSKRRRNKLLVPIIYITLGLLALALDRVTLSAILIIIGVLWFFVYPFWEKQRYIKHYKSFIEENYKNRLGRAITLEFNNDYILGKDNGNESKILTTEIEEIYEIPTIVFVRLKGGQSFILPKDKIADFDKLKVRIKELTNHLKINYVVDEKWEWK